MYDRDMPIVRSYGLANPDNLANVITFVLLTIQQPLGMVAQALRHVKQNGEHSYFLFGIKRDGFKYVQEHKHVIFAAVKKAAEIKDVVGAIDVLLNVPSLGLVKSAFVCQLVGMEVGCLDTHNLTRFELNYNAVRFLKATIKTQKTREKKIRNYVTLCQKLGGARSLWDNWCAYVASPDSRATRFETANDVSAEHWKALGIIPAADSEAEEIPF